MKSSHFHTQGWTSGKTTTHPGVPEIHQHLDDNSHLFDEMIKSSHLASGKKPGLHQPAKAKVLFQFFDGWPMPKS